MVEPPRAGSLHREKTARHCLALSVLVLLPVRGIVAQKENPVTCQHHRVKSAKSSTISDSLRKRTYHRNRNSPRWSNHLRRGVLNLAMGLGSPIRMRRQKSIRQPGKMQRYFVPIQLRHSLWRSLENPRSFSAGVDRRPLQPGCRIRNKFSASPWI